MTNSFHACKLEEARSKAEAFWLDMSCLANEFPKMSDEWLAIQGAADEAKTALDSISTVLRWREREAREADEVREPDVFISAAYLNR